MPRSCWKRARVLDYLQIRKPFARLVALSFGVEGVGVVDETEKDDNRFFWQNDFWGMLGLGYPMPLWVGNLG